MSKCSGSPASRWASNTTRPRRSAGRTPRCRLWLSLLTPWARRHKCWRFRRGHCGSRSPTRLAPVKPRWSGGSASGARKAPSPPSTRSWADSVANGGPVPVVATAEALDQLEAFRRATVDLREEFIREFALLWPGAAALSAPGVARQQWLELVVALVQRWRPVFAQVAMETYRTQAVLEVGAVPAFLAAGGAGVVVPDLDVAELVAAMVVLVFTPLGRDAERAAAFRRASQQREAQRRAEVGLPPPELELDIPREDRVTPREARIFDQAAEAAARLAVNGGRDAVQRAV